MMLNEQLNKLEDNIENLIEKQNTIKEEDKDFAIN